MFGKSEKHSLKKGNSNIWFGFKPILLFLARLSILALVTALIGYGLHYAHQSPAAVAQFGWEQIEYQGLVHLKKETLDSLILKTVPQNILLIDLDRLRQLVESESWVKEARLRRKLPNRLLIDVSERQPTAVAAIDNELYVVDSEGVVLDPHGPPYHSINRPIVKGLKNVARENAREDNALRMRIYLQVLVDLGSSQKEYDQSISEIDVENPERVAIIPDNDPVHIYLGNSDFLTRYETFLSQKELYDRLKEQYGFIESVDVTYDNKIIFHTPEETRGAVPDQTGEQS
jgi:hypothetical protein